MKKRKNYKVVISKVAVNDITAIKKYILHTFHYREYAENFSKRVKKAIQDLSIFPQSHIETEYVIKGQNIYFKVCDTYLIFYVIEEERITVIRVLKDRMN